MELPHLSIWTSFRSVSVLPVSPIIRPQPNKLAYGLAYGLHSIALLPPSLYRPRNQLTYFTLCECKSNPQQLGATHVWKSHPGDFTTSREEPVRKSRIAGGMAVLQGQRNITNGRSMSWFLRSAVLVCGFGLLPFCKPAFAENVVVPSTVGIIVDGRGEADMLSTTSTEVDPNGVVETETKLGRSGSREDDSESRLGEASDLTKDPAEVLLRSYLELHPSDKKALQALLFMRLKKGEVDASLSVLQKLTAIEPENLEWKYIRAQAHEYAGNLQEARQDFEEILRIKPLSARALQGLALIMHKTGDEEQALQLLMEAAKKAVDAGQSKEAINLRMLLGQLHTMQGNLDKALELYKIVIEEDPRDYRPYLCQGLLYSIIGEEAEAEKQFRQYRKLCPKNFPHRGFLDELMLKAKRESQKLKAQMKEEESCKLKGKKPRKVMRHPLATEATKPFKDDPNART